ncbi:hypothetical protein ElyMa_001617900 [Elysia marginata]|uniref:Uncharacterized protein n=1 Tax=Elysia marginata TaxID=1093978 RepID=A0AAV4JNI0_9GAST|nr:hypothetical protein ElyMa_001617900 [Elysia marginata]
MDVDQKGGGGRAYDFLNHQDPHPAAQGSHLTANKVPNSRERSRFRGIEESGRTTEVRQEDRKKTKQEGKGLSCAAFYCVTRDKHASGHHFRSKALLGVAASGIPNQPNNLSVVDRSSGRSYLLDTATEVSVYPASVQERKSQPPSCTLIVIAANGTSIHTLGNCNVFFASNEVV